MNKFSFNSDELKKSSKSLLNASLDVDKAINAVGELDIPDFSHSNFLSELPDKLGKIKYAIINDEEWIDNAISVLESFNNDSITDIEGLEVHSYFSKSININVVE